MKSISERENALNIYLLGSLGKFDYFELAFAGHGYFVGEHGHPVGETVSHGMLLLLLLHLLLDVLLLLKLLLLLQLLLLLLLLLNHSLLRVILRSLMRRTSIEQALELLVEYELLVDHLLCSGSLDLASSDQFLLYNLSALRCRQRVDLVLLCHLLRMLLSAVQR